MTFTTAQASASATFIPPPLDGSLSLPEIFDLHRKRSPNHPLFVYEECGDIQVITWSHAVRAVHTAARYIESSLSVDGEHDRSTVVAILANTDTFTFFVLIVGILRAGYQAFPISPRNSAAGVAHLLHSTNAKYMVVSHDPGIQRLCAAVCAQPSMRGASGTPLQFLPLPTFEYLFGGSEDEFEPLPPMIPPLSSDPSLILHSSGSMSYPKPIAMPYRNLFNFGLAPYYGGRDLCGQVFSCHALPMYHAIGCVMLPLSMMSGLVISSFPPNDTPMVPSPDRVFSGAIVTRSDYIFCVPSFIESWARDPEHVEDLRRFKALIFAGAPMHKESGDKLASQGINLVPFYGSTEIGPAVAFIPRAPHNEGWEYFHFSPHCKPLLVPYSENVYQVCFLECPTHSPNVLNTEFQGMKAFDSRDLVERHPTNPELWRIYGRCDEQIVHSTGEKTNPVPIESMLLRHPKIQSVVMFGRGRYHTGILVQPTPEEQFDPTDEAGLAKYRNEIWPLVEQANDRSPTHSRLFKEMVLVAHPSKPFLLTVKGTPQKKMVLDCYQSEIEGAYAAVEESSQTDLQTPDTWELEGCILFVRTAVLKVMRDHVTDDDDIFQAGCDSLQATWIRNTILHALRHSAKASTRKIPHNFVYFNPTIRRLGTYVSQIVHYGQNSVALFMSSRKVSEMEHLYHSYSENFQDHRCSTQQQQEQGDVVLLTGSTGFLGSHILEQLVRDPTVRRVYTLNRRDSKGQRSVYTRHERTFSTYQIDLAILQSSKIVFLEGDPASDSFDLGEETYFNLQSEITCIMHNAWRVDFNVSLSSMEPLIACTRGLIDLALGSPLAAPPRFVFVSSLGVFSNWSGDALSPEASNVRPTSAIGTGYTESKWVAERILEKAAEQTALRPAIVRVGHLCGGHQGSWSSVEWLPVLIRSAQVLGCLPFPDGNVTWMPVHTAAAALVEMRSCNDRFLNLSHPNPVPSAMIYSAFAEALQVPLVNYQEWLGLLETLRRENSESNTALTAATSIPALVLLDYFRAMYRPPSNFRVDKEAFGFPTAIIERALAAAPNTLKDVPQLTTADVASWLKYWHDIGFLTS